MNLAHVSIQFDDCSIETLHEIESILKEIGKHDVFYLETDYDKSIILFDSVDETPWDTIEAVSIQFPQISFHVHSSVGFCDGYSVHDDVIVAGESQNYQHNYYSIFSDEDLQEMTEETNSYYYQYENAFSDEDEGDFFLDMPFEEDD